MIRAQKFPGNGKSNSENNDLVIGYIYSYSIILNLIYVSDISKKHPAFYGNVLHIDSLQDIEIIANYQVIWDEFKIPLDITKL